MTNYKSFANKIRSAKTTVELNKLESKMDKLYESGIFSVNEFARLDGLIMDCYAEIYKNKFKK